MENSGRPISEIVNLSMERIKELIDVNIVVGNMISTPDGAYIIPVSKVSVGFASGGGEYGGSAKKKSDEQSTDTDKPANFGGGIGTGIKITPLGFLTSTNGNVRFIPVMPSGGSPLDHAVEMIPDIIDKVSSFIKSKKNEQEESPSDETEPI